MRRRWVLLVVGLGALALPASAPAADFKPEDEFRLDTWVSLHLGPLDMSVNKAVVYLWLASLVTILTGIVLMRVRIGTKPGTRQTIGETIYEVAQVNIAEQGLPTKAVGLWFPYVATLLLFIVLKVPFAVRGFGLGAQFLVFVFVLAYLRPRLDGRQTSM